MKLIYQLHNIGIYLDDANTKWSMHIEEELKKTLDGFELFIDEAKIQDIIVIKNYSQLDILPRSLNVPENSYYMPDGTFVYTCYKIAYKFEENKVVFWAENDAWIILFLFEQILRARKKTFVHGAGISVRKGNQMPQGILLLAFGGIGKTSFISKALLNDSVKLLGDDLIILNENGSMSAYPRPFCLYEYHQELFPEFFAKHKVRYTQFKEKQYIRRLYRRVKRELGFTDKNIYSYYPVSPVRLFGSDKIERENVPISRIYILRRVSGINAISVKAQTDINKAVNFALNVVVHEWDIGLRMQLHKAAQEQSSFTRELAKMEDIIRGALSGVQNYIYIDIPENYDAMQACTDLNSIILRQDV